MPCHTCGGGELDYYHEVGVPCVFVSLGYIGNQSIPCTAVIVFTNNTIEGCPLLIFSHRRLAWQLINNHWLHQEAQKAAAQAPPAPIHQLMTAPNHARKWSGGAWLCDASYQYQGYFCSMKCKKHIRTYCICDPGRWLCKDCLVAHAQQHEHHADM